MNQATNSPLRIGPAGWSYRDWEGIVYPSPRPRGLDPLLWIARFFDYVEINVSFYRIPTTRQSESWVERTREVDLAFSAKVPQEFTHRGAPVDAVSLGPLFEFLRPMAEAGRLDAVLAQFPWSARPGADLLDRMQRLRDVLAPHEVVFEVRHGDWAAAAWTERLVGLGLDLVHVDQPSLRGNLGPDFGPGRRAYVRLHGRNAQNWFARDAGRDARYDWLYGIDDLRAWATRIEGLLAERSSVRVVTNNHFQGQAVVNAIELNALLGRPAREVPRGIVEHFPERAGLWKTIGLQPSTVQADPEPPRRRRTSSTQGELF